MLKSFLLTVLSTVLTTFLSETSYSLTVPIPQVTPSLKVAKSETKLPICYLETANGSILDLSKLCEQKQTDSSIRTKSSTSPYDASAIKKFNDDLYGEEN